MANIGCNLGPFSGDDLQKPQNVSSRELPEKTFVVRNSPLTDIFKEHKLIYNVFAAVQILVIADEVLTKFAESGQIDLKFREVFDGLRGLSVNFLVWSCLQMCTLCVYPCFLGWVYGRRRLRESAKKFVDVCCVCGLVIYQVTFVAVTVKAILLLDRSPVSSLSILLEMTRFVLKIHAFVRSSVPEVLKENAIIPTFRQFVYFLFAPTLIYRNEYPRTETIRWRIVLNHTLEIIALLYMCYIYSGSSPLFNQTGITPSSPGSTVHKLFLCILPANYYYIYFIYASMHSWHNAWAELLRFGDRLFYRDWWNATSFAAYVRAHNVIVHNFLYTYVYKDFYDKVWQSKKAAAIVVFLTSALVHEAILTVSLRFFYPVLLGQFLFMGLLIANVEFGNVIVLALLSVGHAIETSQYSTEYYARRNCPERLLDNRTGPWSLEGLVPVSWSCGVFSSAGDNWTVSVPL